MAEKKTTKKAETTKATATKKAAAPKKACAKKACATKAAEATIIDVINVGYKAGDVYQTLAKADNALSAAEIAKTAKITLEEAYLGIGWLFKEGKVKGVENKVELA